MIIWILAITISYFTYDIVGHRTSSVRFRGPYRTFGIMTYRKVTYYIVHAISCISQYRTLDVRYSSTLCNIVSKYNI
jgi:hypothetical protein